MTYFDQIIFPPKPKPASFQSENYPKDYNFDAWIVGSTADTKVLWVKCPVCLHTYNFQNVACETTLKHNLREYEPYYWRKIIRECPERNKHWEKQCQTTSKK